MNEYDLVPWAVAKGLEDGANAAAYRGPLMWGISEQVDYSYIQAYWQAFATSRYASATEE